MATTLALHSALGVITPTSNPGFMVLRNQHPLYSMSEGDVGVWTGKMPQSYDGSSDIIVIINGSLTTATSGNVQHTIAFERIAASGQDIDSDGFATGVDNTSTTVPGTSGHIMSVSKSMTNAECDGIQPGDDYRIRITRKSISGATGDYQLKSIELRQA